MLYVKIKPRVVAQPAQALTLGDVADVLADASLRAEELAVQLPQETGIWAVEAIVLLRQIMRAYPKEQVTVLGDGIGWLHRVKPQKPKRFQFLRTLALFLLMFLGSALAVGWFHSDVNMQEAQQTLYRIVAGHAASSPLLIAVPYALGMGVGVASFYALIGRKTVSPLTIKLRAYQADVEQNAKGGANG